MIKIIASVGRNGKNISADPNAVKLIIFATYCRVRRVHQPVIYQSFNAAHGAPYAATFGLT